MRGGDEKEEREAEMADCWEWEAMAFWMGAGTDTIREADTQ